MSAPVVRIPGPRRPAEPESRPTESRPTEQTAPLAGPAQGADVPAPRATPGDRPHDGGHGVPYPWRAAPGRHRGPTQVFPSAAQTFTVLARAGSLTTLAAMVVLAAAVAGLADGNPPTGPAAEIAVSSLDR